MTLLRRVPGYGDPRLIVEVFPATQLIDLLDDVLLRFGGQSNGPRRNTTHALVAHVREPRQFLVELLVVLVVGEVRRLDPKEVGKCRHGRSRWVRSVA